MCAGYTLLAFGERVTFLVSTCLASALCMCVCCIALHVCAIGLSLFVSLRTNNATYSQAQGSERMWKKPKKVSLDEGNQNIV